MHTTTNETVDTTTTLVVSEAPVASPFESSELSLDEILEQGRERYNELSDIAGRAGVGSEKQKGDLVLTLCNLAYGTADHLTVKTVKTFLSSFGNPEASDISKERNARYAILSAHLCGVHSVIGSIPSAKHVHAIMLKTDLKFDYVNLRVDGSLESMAKARDFAIAYLALPRGKAREKHMLDVGISIAGESGTKQSQKDKDREKLARTGEDAISDDLRQDILERQPTLNPAIADIKAVDAMIKRFAKSIDNADLTAASRVHLQLKFNDLIAELETPEEREALYAAGIYSDDCDLSDDDTVVE